MRRGIAAVPPLLALTLAALIWLPGLRPDPTQRLRARAVEALDRGDAVIARLILARLVDESAGSPPPGLLRDLAAAHRMLGQAAEADALLRRSAPLEPVEPSRTWP